MKASKCGEGIQLYVVDIEERTIFNKDNILRESECIVYGTNGDVTTQFKLEHKPKYDDHVTTECVIPLQHHQTVKGAKGANVQEISRLHEVKIKFPERPVNGDNNIPNEVNTGRENEVMSPKTSDVITITGKSENCEKAKTALLALVPVIEEVIVPFKFHGQIIGHKGGNIRKLTEEFNVTLSIPPSNESSDLIKVTGTSVNVQRAKTALEKKVVSFEKAEENKVFVIKGPRANNLLVRAVAHAMCLVKIVEQNLGRLKLVLDKRKRIGLNLNNEICEFRKNKLELFAHVIGSDGIPPSPAYVAAIRKTAQRREPLKTTSLPAREKVTVEVLVPFKFRGHIIGQKGANLRKMMEEFSVTISIPPSKKSSDLITVTGVPTDVQRAKAALEQTVSRLEKKNDKRSAKQSQSRAPRRFHKSPGTGQVMTAAPRKLKVSNIPKGITAETLQMLFENEKRSGGGEVKDLKFDQDLSAAVIEFEDHSVIDRVLRRQPIEIQGKQLNVEVSKESDEYEPVIEDENENYDPSKTTIEIRGISKDITTEMLELYFENKKRSGGGPVSSIERTDKVALITFESEADTNTVLQRSHRLNEIDLDIELYTPQEPVLMYQKKFLITGLNEKITVDCLTNFLEAKGCVSLKEILYAEDDEQKALVTFESPPDFKKLQNACQGKKLEGAELEVLQVPVSRSVIATNVTPKTSKDMVEMYFENTVRKGEWHVQNVETMEEGAFVIYLDDVLAAESVLEQKHVIDNCHIELQLFHPCIGKTISVEKYRLKQTNGNEKKIHNQIIRNEKKLSKLEVCFLSTINFPEIVRMKCSEVKCTIQQEDDIIIYEGKHKYIKQAEELMHDSIQTIQKSALPNNSRSKLQLLTMKETRDYLKQKFEENGCLGVWEIDRDCVTVCDISDQKANEGIHIIKKCLVQNIISMTPEERFILNSDAWTVMLASIDKQHQGYNIIDVHIQDATVEITSTDQYAGEIVEIIRDFLNVNALYKQTITVERFKVRYLEQWQRAQIDDICKSKEESRVKIELNQGVITLEGRQKDLCEAENKISVLLKQICCKQKSFEKPGMRKYLYSEKGEELVKQIENVNKCTIYLTNQEDDTDKTCVYEHELEHQNHHPQTVECLNCRVPGGRSIFVFHGDITDFDIHILISTCNKTMDQTAGLAKAIVEKGGDVILKECLQHKRQNKLEGDVFFTNGGNLKCKIIAHGVIPVWQEGSDNEEYLKEIVLKSLEEADKRKLTSIGIPAIGTGIFGFPVSLATGIIVRAVQEHFQDIIVLIGGDLTDFMKGSICSLMFVKELTLENTRQNWLEFCMNSQNIIVKAARFIITVDRFILRCLTQAATVQFRGFA
ncbi:hypothetical protein CHS0354_006394 [Potamilus streckersoni]|uniref:Poly [ADP-ribose] polymerase 14 n=1 Tax=Potamilus streckersoni TaxID=2493646 RepID=A0AAE0T9X7_9BIVA|nr:hypothetical protein CHS0354_006394 [Potamilus streckersoni]